MKIAVIGGGPAGMTAAYELSKKIKDVDLYEASSSVGGMAKTIELWNQKVDIGPHRFFSDDTRINELWLEVVGKDYEMVDRLTRIYYNKKFFHYPIKAFNALKNLGIFQAARCVVNYGIEKLFPTKDTSTFEGWVTNRFGKRLYQIFFKTYTEKLWGIPCDVLDADFAAQRIKKFSLGEAIKSALFGNSGKHKTLVDQFAYPHGGTGMVYERMSDFIKKQGGNVHLKTPIEKIITRNNVACAIQLQDGTIKEYDHIISSMPLSLMVARLPEAPEPIRQAAASLRFRNTIIVYLNVQANNLFPDNWLYIHSSDLLMGRLTNFRNWVPSLYNNEKSTICALEYWCYDEDDFWKWDEKRLIELGKEELRKTGLIGTAEITDGYVYKIHRCYPVYSTGYKETLKPVEDYLSTVKNLHVIGRYGAFKYNNQDHSILMGKLAVENILEGKQHNLWEINTDYESYQESSVITKTGLQKVSKAS
jgi:protoporphyrinogen oxidase